MRAKVWRVKWEMRVYTGHDRDVLRHTIELPRQDQRGISHFLFGSAHATGWQMAFCDGSVRTMSYSIDANTHLLFGSRADGEAVDLTRL